MFDIIIPCLAVLFCVAIFKRTGSIGRVVRFSGRLLFMADWDAAVRRTPRLSVKPCIYNPWRVHRFLCRNRNCV